MKFKFKVWKSLYIRISVTFVLMLVMIGAVYVWIVYNSAKDYYQEANQKLNASIASHIAKEIKPFVNGEVDNKALGEMFHNTMVLNPSIEIYLLDTKGNILSFFAPEKKVLLKQVELEPIKEFIACKGQKFLCSKDPRKPEIHKVFSAAEVIDQGSLVGYIYVVLAGEDYDSIVAMLQGSFFMRVGILSILLTLIAAALIGLLIIWVLTKNLYQIVVTFKKFAAGDLKSRIQIRSTSELAILATTFNEMAETIVSNIEKLKAVEKLKSELIANISHDLRTPLSVIHGYIETLSLRQEKMHPEEKKKYMEVVLKNTEKLEKLVSDLFEISKLDSLNVQPSKEPFFVNELVSDIMGKYQLVAEEKKIQFVPNMGSGIKRVYADLGMIDRVLQNLIDNAFKFTNEYGTITVSVKNKENATVEIKVIDTGEGISREKIPLIFNRFYTTSISSKTEGSGLGLAIVKKIIDLHNSNVTVESKLGEGSTFTFWLDIYDTPFQKANANRIEKIKQEKLNPDIKTKTQSL